MAVAALVLGICSWVFYWVPVVNWILQILAIVFGIIGIIKGQKRVMAIIGLALGATAFLGGFIIFGAAAASAASMF